jgi:glutathione peroxidase
VVLGFPSNDFGAQEPGNETHIQSFCRNTYSIEFPMFEKTRVRKGNADPLFQVLASKAGEYPGWNFHKYLLNREGALVGSFPSQVKPQSHELVNAINDLL